MAVEAGAALVAAHPYGGDPAPCERTPDPALCARREPARARSPLRALQPEPTVRVGRGGRPAGARDRRLPSPGASARLEDAAPEQARRTGSSRLSAFASGRCTSLGWKRTPRCKPPERGSRRRAAWRVTSRCLGKNRGYESRDHRRRIQLGAASRRRGRQRLRRSGPSRARRTCGSETTPTGAGRSAHASSRRRARWPRGSPGSPARRGAERIETIVTAPGSAGGEPRRAHADAVQGDACSRRPPERRRRGSSGLGRCGRTNDPAGGDGRRRRPRRGLVRGRGRLPSRRGPSWVRSIEAGALRVTRAFLGGDPPDEERIAHARRGIAELARDLRSSASRRGARGRWDGARSRSHRGRAIRRRAPRGSSHRALRGPGGESDRVARDHAGTRRDPPGRNARAHRSRAPPGLRPRSRSRRTAGRCGARTRARGRRRRLASRSTSRSSRGSWGWRSTVRRPLPPPVRPGNEGRARRPSSARGASGSRHPQAGAPPAPTTAAGGRPGRVRTPGAVAVRRDTPSARSRRLELGTLLAARATPPPRSASSAVSQART